MRERCLISEEPFYTCATETRSHSGASKFPRLVLQSGKVNNVIDRLVTGMSNAMYGTHDQTAKLGEEY